MNPEIAHKIAFKLWPDLETQPPAQQRQGLTLVSLVLTLWPYLPLALIWLGLVSDWSVLRQHILLLSLLLLALLFLNERSYQLIIRLSKDVELPLAGSLSDILEVTLLFLFGPTALWLPVMTSLFFVARAGWRAYREGQSYYIWYPLNILVQAAGANIFVYLVAMLVYDRLGGVYPLAPAVTDWLPALVAILIIVFLTMFIYLPMLLTTNRISGVENSPQTLLPVLGAGSLITLLKTPFAIPLALVYTMAGTAVFLFLVLGVALANLLAYTLSQSNLRTQARSRELAHLEEMGQAIIQAPGDASTLADVVAAALPGLFRTDRIAVALFEPPPDETWHWLRFSLAHPPAFTLPAGVTWEQLRRAEADYLITRGLSPQANGLPAGDLIGVKIMVDAPGEAESRCVGGVYLHRGRSIREPEAVLPTVQELAQQIGAALYRADVHADTLARQKMAQELAFAGRIQSSFLPDVIPDVPGWQIAATLIPARQTSGDFYDFVPLDNGRVGLLVADVADKGTGAALYMALSRTLIRTYAMQYPDAPAQALAAANARILADTASDQFVTVFYGVLQPETGTFTYANAGHNPAFLVGEETQALTNTGIPLGMFGEMEWSEEVVRLGADDVLLIYSDGVSEAQDESRREFGEERLLAAANGAAGRSAQAVQDAVIAAVEAFVGAAPQFDDITLMVARREREDG